MCTHIKKLLFAGLLTVLTAVFSCSVYQILAIGTELIEEHKVYDQVEAIINAANDAVDNSTCNTTQLIEFYANNKIVVIDLKPFSLQKMTKNAFDELKAVNDDLVGYLWFDSDLIKEPIVQASDNSYYLYRDLYKNSSEHGTVFMNYQNSLDDMNLTMYGHNNRNDYSVKFARFNDMYGDQDYYENNAHFAIYFENEVRRYTICYVYRYGNFNDFDHQVTTLSEDDFDEFIQFMAERNSIEPIDIIVYGDRFVTLQTCMRGDSSRRVLLVAKETGCYSYNDIS